MWASLATHLNDYDEIVHGQRMIREEFDSLRAKGRIKDLLSGLRRRGSPIAWDADLDPEKPWTDVYVACFTQLGDSLRMWRGYGAERGYALTFKVRGLPSDLFLVEVRYDRKRAVRWIGDLLATLVAFYRRARQDELRLEDDVVVDALKLGLGLAAAIFKRRQWRDEREWRLVQWCSDPRALEFRERDGRVVPYIEVPVPGEFKLGAITIGPGHHQAIEEKAVDLLKSRYPGGRAITINHSKVSLRRH